MPESFKITYWDSEHKMCYKRVNDHWDTVVFNLKHHGITQDNLVKIEVEPKHQGA